MRTLSRGAFFLMGAAAGLPLTTGCSTAPKAPASPFGGDVTARTVDPAADLYEAQRERLYYAQAEHAMKYGPLVDHYPFIVEVCDPQPARGGVVIQLVGFDAGKLAMEREGRRRTADLPYNPDMPYDGTYESYADSRDNRTFFAIHDSYPASPSRIKRVETEGYALGSGLAIMSRTGEKDLRLNSAGCETALHQIEVVMRELDYRCQKLRDLGFKSRRPSGAGIGFGFSLRLGL